MKVKKEKVKTWVYLRNYSIYGNIYITEGARLSDNLNYAIKKNDLLPMTDCTIYFLDGSKKKTDFLLLNINSVSFFHVGQRESI